MRRWILIGLALLIFILLPFFLFEAQFNAWAETLAASDESRWLACGLLSGLLALDIVLPVPSSLISTAIGGLAGLWLGTLVNWVAMTIGALLGYWLGARAGSPAALRLTGPDELKRMRGAMARYGPWMLVVFRPVPVLAEASVLFAGMVRMEWRPFLLYCVTPNLGISFVYAFVGTTSRKADSFLLAFAGALLVPLVAMLIARRR
ncbi:MAG: VTT domain-containing protein [Bryobacterales bacterium]|nr:VTT domain-containing protein [Bryobacterales bacterium]